MSRPGSMPARKRVGHVSLYEHHGSWFLYYRQGGRPRRTRIGGLAQAECEASLLNAELVAADAGLALGKLLSDRFGDLLAQTGIQVPSDTALAFTVAAACTRAAATTIVSVADLRAQFLDHHELVLKSAMRTLSRYRAATLYLENFARDRRLDDARAISAAPFVAYLRAIEVSPNGHANTAKRKLADKGVRYIAETCRSVYHFGIDFGVLPPGSPNPFSKRSAVPIRIRDAKPIFVFDAQLELSFLTAASTWAFAVHFTLAKTGLRPGELVHLLIEDVDLENGWLSVRGKPELGWATKTNTERRVPLVPEVVTVLQQQIGKRCSGVLFLRQRLTEAHAQPPKLIGTRADLAAEVGQRLRAQADRLGRPLARREEAQAHERVWSDAGAVPVDRVRTSFIRTAKAAGIANATCPKSWRHTFATLLQQANVDVLVRQETLGHKPAAAYASALGMTGVYTHTTAEFQRGEIERALRLRPESLALGAAARAQPTNAGSCPSRATDKFRPHGRDKAS